MRADELGGVSEDKIRSIIKRFDNDNDRTEATCGFCGTFALALYRYLRRQGEPAHLYFAFAGGHSHMGAANWAHIFVQAHGKFWDVTGDIDPRSESFQDFYGVDDISITSERDVVKMITHPELNKQAYARPIYNRWKSRMTA